MIERIHEVISVVSYGNEALFTGGINSLFLDHLDHDPSEWYQLRIKEKCKKFRSLFEPSDCLCSFGTAEEGGEMGGSWSIVPVFEGYSDCWNPEWNYRDRRGNNGKIYTVTYGVTEQREINVKHLLEGLKKRLFYILNDISELSSEIDVLQNYVKTFCQRRVKNDGNAG